MRFKYMMILTIVLTSLFAVSAVSATDIDTNDTQIVSVSDNDEIVSIDSDLNVLTDNEEGDNYSDLRMEIGSGGDKILTKKNYRYVDGDGDTIKIEQPGVIDGKGAVIDMAGSTIRAFNVTASGVTIKNLTIKNVNYTGDGGGIYFSSSGNVTNCNFTNNSARYGGVIYFNNQGTVTNCNFIENNATSGGAVYFYSLYYSYGKVENCNFTNNIATQNGGAVYFDWDCEGSVENCNFIKNKATSGSGGAVSFSSQGKCNVANCNFTDNKAFSDGGAFVFSMTGVVINCNFTNNTATSGYGGAVYFFSIGGTVTNCNFTNNSASGDGGAVYFDSGGDGSVENCNFTNNSASGGGGAINMGSGTLINCNFINNTASSQGGAIRFSNSGTVTNCNFINNSALETFYKPRYKTGLGGAIYFISQGSVENCNFTNNSATCDGGAVYFDRDGGAVYFFSYYKSTVKNCNFINNSALGTFNKLGYYTGLGGAINMGSGTLTDCNFTNNSAIEGGAVSFLSEGNVLIGCDGECNVANCNFTNNTATQNGGAVLMSWLERGSVENCNFIKNKATSGSGGAFLFRGYSRCNVTNCNFIGNNATYSAGGAIYFCASGTAHEVRNCNFANNSARYGGAINFNGTDNPAREYDGGPIIPSSGSVTNSNFIDNNATSGGAVYFFSYYNGTVKNCNFIDNNATSGGAIYFTSHGSVENCNFTNNSATGDAGAVYFYTDYSKVENCNFTNNTAIQNGGAVYFKYSIGRIENCNFTNNKVISGSGGAVYIYNSDGTVKNCNFTDNKAFSGGGAIVFARVGHVINCSFTNNTADKGGAIYFYKDGYVTNCNFIDNNATSGGAVYFKGIGHVTNCNFTGNNATTGSAIYFSAIYFSSTSSTKISNSIFLNNRANSEALEITKNDNNITITFKGKDNLLNAIYSEDDAEVRFINVTYWGASGIANTGSSTIKPSRSNKEAGQNITVGVVVNGELVLSDVKVTDENGMIVLDISAGENYFIGIRHDVDSYYTEALKTISNNPKFNVNVTSQTTTNRTLNITAKSNIPNEIIKGKLLFVLPNGTEISANYNAEGTWWAVHTFEDIGDYEINASCSDGLDNVTVNNATVSIRINVPINVNNVNIFFDDVANVVVSVPEELNGQNITITVNGTSKNSTVKNGNATASFADLPAGEHIINVDYSGDGINSANSTTAKLTVSKVDTVIVVNTAFSRYATDYYSDGTKDGVNGERGGFFYATLYDVNGNPLVNKTVRIAINGPIYNVTTDENGQAGLQVNLAKANTYTYSLYFPGDEGYSASLLASSKLTVVKKPTSIISNSKYAFKTSAKTKTVTVALNTIKNPFNNKLYLKAGKKLTLTVKGKTYSAKTNSKGVAKFNIKLTKKGTYTATVKFAGDSTYGSVSKSIKISILSLARSNAALKGVGIGTTPKELDNPSTLNIEGNYADYVANSNISTGYASPAKKATIIVVDKNFTRNATDYYSDGTKDGVNGERGGFFYATLTDTDGNPLANKTVQIAVNGPIYNVITNEYGQAGLQVNLAKANTYTYALSFSGDDEYCPAMLASSKLTVIKKPITIAVKGLSFKVNAKTKTVTVNLKTIKNAYDGKTYLKDGKKVTLNVNGVTYTGFIKKGVVKFNVKLARKGNYRAVVSFAGDSTYGSASKTVNIKVK